jgi:MSHA biogenesis protein MshL
MRTEGKSVHSTRLLLVPILVAAASAVAGSQTVPLPPLPVTRLDARQTDLELDGRRMSFGFAQPTPVRDVLLMLVRGTRLSLIPQTTIEQTFVGDLKNVTLREALDLILEPIGLDYSVRGQVIRVFPRELETRLYSVDYVSAQRSVRSRAATAGTGSPNVVPDLYDDLAEGVRSLLSPGGRMNLDRAAALLQVTDTPSRHARVENYLETVMLRATRQVQIEATLIEVELRDQFSAGIDWPAALGKLTRPVDASALLKALAEQGSVNVLARPRVTAMNNEPAVMRMGTQEGQTLTEGVALSVTPQISADGIINMSINPSITERTGAATSRLGENVPIISVREADTLVRVRQGETIAVAGLMSEKSSRKIELVILLTPTIMFPGDTAQTR